MGDTLPSRGSAWYGYGFSATLRVSRLKTEPVVQPGVSQLPGFCGKSVPGPVVIEANPVPGTQQLINRAHFFHERPTGRAVRALSSHDQKRTRSNEGHHLMVFLRRNVL